MQGILKRLEAPSADKTVIRQHNVLSFHSFGDAMFLPDSYTYEAHPQSKFPWGRLQKQNIISWKYLLQQIEQVFSYFSTYSPLELRHLSYRGTNF
jgi:hypothetical protein